MRPLLQTALSIALSVTLAGCHPGVRACRKGTVLVSLTAQGDARAADEVDVEVSVDGAAAVDTPIPLDGRSATGTIEIDFPSGYKQGASVVVTITLQQSGSAIASSSTTVTLTGTCANVALTVGNAPAADLAGADLTGVDLSSADLAGVDLAGVDLAAEDLHTGIDLGADSSAGGDLASADLRPNPDLRYEDLMPCGSTTESCFNGVDDNCDGLVDCADPQCNASARCVPDPGSFTLGGVLSSGTTCPSDYPLKTTIWSGFTGTQCGTGTCGGCGSIANPGCDFELDNDDMSCSGNVSSNGFELDSFSASTCHSFTPITSGYHILFGSFELSGCTGSPSGTPTPTPAAFSATGTFCGRTAANGGGCPALSGHPQICVPILAASKFGGLKTGSQLACPSNLTLDTTRYYTGKTDATCACNCTAVSGDCTGSADFTDCGAASNIPEDTCSNTDISTVSSVKIKGPSKAGSCNPGAIATSSTAPTGEQTLCFH